MDDGRKRPESGSRISRRSPKKRPATEGHSGAGKPSVRVVVADNDPIILSEIGKLLATRFDVVARAGNGRELVEVVQRLSPAVVVVDITMPEMNGIEAARRITKANPSVKVVMLSVHDDPTYIEAAFEAGASGYVLKLRASKELIRAIEDVLMGRLYSPHALG